MLISGLVQVVTMFTLEIMLHTVMVRVVIMFTLEAVQDIILVKENVMCLLVDVQVIVFVVVIKMSSLDMRQVTPTQMDVAILR